MNTPSNVQRRTLWAACIGSFLDLFDFSIFGYFSPVLAAVFFPNMNHTQAVLWIFGIYTIGFLIRPFGALMFGYFGDTKGRRDMLVLSLILMAITTFLIGIIPSGFSIGIAASLILLLFRILQGFACGGEFAGATILVIEFSPPRKRGFYTSWVYFSIVLGLLVGSALASLLSVTLQDEALISIGWRIPFLFGVLLAFVGIFLRQSLDDTPVFLRLKEQKKNLEAPITQLFTSHKMKMLIGLGLLAAPAALVGLNFMYLSTYLIIFVRVPIQQALFFNALTLIVLLVCIPFTGYLSDLIGRKFVYFAGALATLIIAFPLFHFMEAESFFYLTIAQIFFGIFSACVLGVFPAILCELFPATVRYSGVALTLNIGFALFCGSVPFIVNYLIKTTYEVTAPGGYLFICALISLITLLKYKETADKELEME